jgi:hypothetical protein
VDIASITTIILVGAFVCGLSLTLQSHSSGWYILAVYYRSSAPFTGRTWRFRAASFRTFYPYWLTLTIGANHSGLYLAQLWPWRLTHPPLLVPWGDVTFEARRWFEIGARSLLLGREHPVRVTISRRIIAEMQGYKNEVFASA